MKTKKVRIDLVSRESEVITVACDSDGEVSDEEIERAIKSAIDRQRNTFTYHVWEVEDEGVEILDD